MAYDSDTGLHACDICGYESEWDNLDDVHGVLWGCERCNDTFCSKCFTDRFGEKVYEKMLREGRLLCPECWEEEREGDDEK